MMKKFDLAKAIAGAPLVTREGKKVVEFHYFKAVKEKQPCYYVIEGDQCDAAQCDIEGQYEYDGDENEYDLFMADEEVKSQRLKMEFSQVQRGSGWHRAPVIGGWVVMYDPDSTSEIMPPSCCCFVPDPNHAWVTE